MTEFAERRRRLADAMEAAGSWPDRSPWTRQAVHALPRHHFAPERLWVWDGKAYAAVDRRRHPEQWADLVYAGPHDPAITQLTAGRPSSSMSAPSIVVDMLDSLMLEEGHRVLELGTGTGWNAGLLAWRVGGGQRVVSVEFDAALADRARARLKAADLEVAVAVGDGAHARPGDEPYDRIISTYAVETVPWAWVAYARPGARIVTPWGRLGHVALTVAADGRSASGWMQGLATFMPAAGVSAGRRLKEVRGDGPPDSERPLGRDLRPLRQNSSLLFALRVALPDVRITTREKDEGVIAWLHDGKASWATLSSTVSDDMAYQGGPRRLADEVDAAWDWWLAQDQPSLYEFGMTVTPDSQVVWVRDPEAGPYWPATTPPAIPAK
ncbi:methyltransferase domain-containing protein [Streptomyces odonnellii]|uniref:methyltransferase domain-containing protein n=1 Tax=Streptomyces odonnellii TaxID=1417980 RepID=UPI000B1EB546|nr:methyltransferase domain-containing protein [Streptomyces odonnellii]